MSLNLRSTVAAALTGAAIVAGTVAAGSASADSESPTVGDSVQYVFYSDVKVNESVFWYNADNDMQDISNASLPSRTENRELWRGSVKFTSRSTYQLAGASIQTSGYFAACRVYVNGTLVSTDQAKGRYALAMC